MLLTVGIVTDIIFSSFKREGKLDHMAPYPGYVPENPSKRIKNNKKIQYKELRKDEMATVNVQAKMSVQLWWHETRKELRNCMKEPFVGIGQGVF